jgi:hypothetical protein
MLRWVFIEEDQPGQRGAGANALAVDFESVAIPDSADPEGSGLESFLFTPHSEQAGKPDPGESDAAPPFVPVDAVGQGLQGRDHLAQRMDQSDISERCAVGIVDISIAFANQSFCYRDNNGNLRSRFHMLWLQDRVFQGAASVAQFPFGTLLLKKDIDHLIATHTHDGVVDEAAIYALFQKPEDGYRDLWKMRAGHGTSVLDLLTGSETATENDYQPIYAVELPTRAIADTSGDRMTRAMTHGIGAILWVRYLEAQSKDAIAGIVINASIAFTGGPHDGTHELVAALEQLMKAPTIRCMDVKICVPRGNHLQDMIHARVTGGTKGHLHWSLPPEDSTRSVLEIWRYRDDVAYSNFGKMKLSVGPTGYTAVPAPLKKLTKPGQALVLQTEGGRPLARLTRSNKHLMLKAFKTRGYGNGPTSPSGTWDIMIEDKTCDDVLCWIQRDDTSKGLRAAGLQSRFSSDSYLKRDAEGDWKKTAETDQDGVRRDGTLSVLATGTAGPWRVVTGWEASKTEGKTSYRFSGRRLDQSAPPKPYHKGFFPAAEESRALGGPLTAGREGRALVRASGTSIATAIAARRESMVQCQTAGQKYDDQGRRAKALKRFDY